MTLDRIRWHFVLIVGFFTLDFTHAQDPGVSLFLVRKWAANFSDYIVENLDHVTQYDALHDRYSNSGLMVEEIKGSDLLKEVAEKWQEMLSSKMEAVTNIVTKLEQLFDEYPFDPSLDKNGLTYYNAKSIIGLEVSYNELFMLNVNTSNSSVQIPTDIYEEDNNILNQILATNPIDEVFVQNAEEDEQLLWQYFGSSSGFYRSYPAQQWVTGGVIDQYDVRRRGWYIQATSSPKNVMILIDVSGSTYGMTLEVIKVSVSKAIDTLGNDDYLSVVSFNADYESVGDFNKFVQANQRNKEYLQKKVLDLKADGEVDFEKVLIHAFEEFEKFEEEYEDLNGLKNNQGADCIKSILIFTDGGRDSAEKVFEDYNQIQDADFPEGIRPDVRVFVYNVGTDSMVSSDGVRAMACNNKGYFSNIRSFGAVRLTTLDYVPVLSRPMVLSGEKNFQWSDIYLDALGLGMMTTLTLPVYNISISNGTKSQELLGVVGTDITTKNMAETVPQRKPDYRSIFARAIGPEGYAFGLNSNGFILLHPRLKAELGYLANPPNVDFLEVEFETPTKVQLRKKMIDGETGSESFDTLVMARDERYTEKVHMSYSYTFIENTTFSVALAQPDFVIFQFKGNETSGTDLGKSVLSLAPDNFGSDTIRHTVLIAPWSFCKGLENAENTSTIYAVLKTNFVDTGGNVPEGECDNDAVFKLLSDGDITQGFLNDLKTVYSADNNGFSALASFVSTQGGLTRVYPLEYTENSWTEGDVLARQDPWEQNYYQRPHYQPGTYVFSVPYNSAAQSGLADDASFKANITVSKVVRVQQDAQFIYPAVVGAFLDSAVFNDTWIGFTNKGANDFEHNFCSNDELEDNHCYLLDDGGFIIATSVDQYQGSVGSFIGIQDGRAMKQLLNHSVFNVEKSRDYQAACPYIESTQSPGVRSIKLPTVADILNINWWLMTTSWSMFRQILYDFLIFGISDEYVVKAETDIPRNVSCIKDVTQYYFGHEFDGEGSFSCSRPDVGADCQRQWTASRINGTNLLLLVVTKKCSNETCEAEVLFQEPQDVQADDIDLVQENEMPRYRRRPLQKCYDFHKDEDDVCSGASATVSIGLAFIILLSIAISKLLST